MILIFWGAFAFIFEAVFFFSSTVYYGPESDSIKFLNLKIPRQCSIFCSCCKKYFCILIKNGIYAKPCIFSLISFPTFITISLDLIPTGG